MALFTDGPPSSLDDLAAQDSQLLGIAGVEGIDLNQKLKLAHAEIGLQIDWLMESVTGGVVVTTPLKLWHTYRTLEMFYADVCHNQVNDRYAGRRDQFGQLARWAYDKLLQVGLGIVTYPLALAAVPIVSAASGSPLPDNTYYVTVAWTNSLQEEGAPAAAVDVATFSRTIRVQPANPPANATGWNVFVGMDPAALVQQNSAPLALEQPWLQYVPLSTTGRLPGTGQLPNYLLPAPRILQRG